MTRPRRRGPDRRWPALLLLIAVVGLGGLLVQLGTGSAPEPVPEPAAGASATVPQPPTPPDTELGRRFREAVSLLRDGRPQAALEALHRVLQIAPELPEAYVNLGYTLLALDRPAAAREAFDTALELRPRQVNAYYGLAVALEALGELHAASGAMRSFLHLCAPDDPFRRRARSALWEWQAALDGADSGQGAPLPPVPPSIAPENG
ncbi:MAG: tetratricopeptide repeat protein [Candidatus Competibacterales bacterium]|nr:tetratricopeptide repeat protein [Candidatus Competibacterales bacterium]